MTHIEQAIRDAVEKGWINKGGDWPVYLGIPLKSVFDDPLFWQALGKARGWDISYNSFGWETAETWIVNWHSFIHALIAGKTAEGFFATL